MVKKEAPQPPVGPIGALVQGFETINAQPWLALLPLLLDLFLWLGPRLSLRNLLLASMDTLPMRSLPGMDIKLLEQAFASFNLFSSLSTAPLGVPSTIAARELLTLQTPLGSAPVWEMSSELATLGLSLLLMVVGLWLGALYLGAVAMQVRTAQLDIGQLLRQVWGDWVQLGLLVLLLLVPLVVFGGPLLIVTLVAFTFNEFLGGLIWLVGTTCLMWVFFYAIYAPHGILLQRRNLFSALWESAQLAQVTLPRTAGMLVLLILLSLGLDWLWNVPADDSWMLLVGIGAHALVATAFFAASFVFYQDHHRWWTEARAAQASAKPARRPNP